MRPATVPRYVQIAELTIAEIYGIDLWKMSPYHRNRIILAALDAEPRCTPEEMEGYIGIVVSDEWCAIKKERKEKKAK